MYRGEQMTRSLIKNVSAWFRSCFWDKIFVKKPEEYKRKIKTPPAYYRGKEKQQRISLKTKK